MSLIGIGGRTSPGFAGNTKSENVHTLEVGIANHENGNGKGAEKTARGLGRGGNKIHLSTQKVR